LLVLLLNFSLLHSLGVDKGQRFWSKAGSLLHCSKISISDYCNNMYVYVIHYLTTVICENSLLNYGFCGE